MTVIMIIISFINSYRWYVIANEFNKVSFYKYFSNIILGLNLSQIFNTTMATDVCKIFFIKDKLGYKKSIIILLYDKLITLFFKIIVIIFFLNIFNFFYSKFLNSYLLFFSSIILVIFLYSFLNNVFLNRLKRNRKIKKIFILDYFISICIKLKKKYQSIYVYNTLIQILITFLYLYIYYLLSGNIELIKISLLVPITEITGQFQFLLLNAKEIFTVFIYSFSDFNKETALVLALAIKISEILSSILLYLFTLIFKNEQN